MCGGGGGGGKRDVAGDASRKGGGGGSGGMFPKKFLKRRSPEMAFPEAISSSSLIQVMIFQRQSYDSIPKTPKMFKYVFWFLLFFNGDFLTPTQLPRLSSPLASARQEPLLSVLAP